jgi:hypothetical protein
VTGTTSWGHRPYEDYVDHNIGNILLLDQLDNDASVTPEAIAAQHARVVALAYPYYKLLESHGLSQPAPVGAIESLLLNVASTTYQKVRSESWPFNDIASLQYAAGAQDFATSQYSGNNDRMKDVIEPSVAAAMAFLMYAGNFAQDPGLNPDIACPINTHFVEPATCAPGAPPVPPVDLNLNGICGTSDGVCSSGGPTGDAGVGAACSTSANCIVGTCVAGTCTTSCTATQPCGVGTCSTAGQCCLGEFAFCESAADCCNDAPCDNNQCVPLVR